jgi:hypothetical protein
MLQVVSMRGHGRWRGLTAPVVARLGNRRPLDRPSATPSGVAGSPAMAAVAATLRVMADSATSFKAGGPVCNLDENASEFVPHSTALRTDQNAYRR